MDWVVSMANRVPAIAGASVFPMLEKTRVSDIMVLRECSIWSTVSVGYADRQIAVNVTCMKLNVRASHGLCVVNRSIRKIPLPSDPIVASGLLPILVVAFPVMMLPIMKIMAAACIMYTVYSLGMENSWRRNAKMNTALPAPVKNSVPIRQDSADVLWKMCFIFSK